MAAETTEEPTNSRRGFFRYYGHCCARFGEAVWNVKAREVLSLAVLAAVTGIVSWFFHQNDALRAAEIALVSLAGWLALFATIHLIQTPWLVHCDTERQKTHWGFGIVGLVLVVLITGGLWATGLWPVQLREPRINFAIADPGGVIGRQAQDIAELKKRPESCLKCSAGAGRPASVHGPNAELIERGRDLFKRINPLLDEWRRNRNSTQPDIINLTMMHLHPRFLNCCYDDAIKFRADALRQLGRTGNREMEEDYRRFDSEKSPFDLATDPMLIEDMLAEIQGLVADLELKDESTMRP
jgi:hypothetical protein